MECVCACACVHVSFSVYTCVYIYFCMCVYLCVFIPVCMYGSKKTPELCCDHVGRIMESKVLRLGVILMLSNLSLDTGPEVGCGEHAPYSYNFWRKT